MKGKKIEATCLDCEKVYLSSGSSTFCETCRKIRDKDLCEIITSSSIDIFQKEEDVIKALEFGDLKRDICLRLDLHDVLDTTDPLDKLSDQRICGLSYVGKTTKTRKDAREDLQSRIKSRQIVYGVLVFKRGKDKHAPFTDVGGKAWFNTLLENTCNPLFIDDSLDHVISVQSVGVKSVQMFQQDMLKDLIDKNQHK